MSTCDLPPVGWRCTRTAGHDGPCAALAASRPAANGGSDVAGYQLAFYELAKIMGIGARPVAPGQVWRNEMLPRLLEAFATPAPPPAEELDAATVERETIEGKLRIALWNALRKSGVAQDACYPIINATISALSPSPAESAGEGK